jgi:phospholipase C
MQDLSQLEHLFVLMLENRSFDHTLGALALEDRREKAPIDGIDLSKRRCNQDAAGRFYEVAKLPPDWSRSFPADPPHGRGSVAAQIETKTGIPMQGFVKTYEQKYADNPAYLARKASVLGYLDRNDLPVSYFLADHFATCQAWFCPIPTGTIPNRLYAIAGHSAGIKQNPKPGKYAFGIPIKTVFEQFDDWVCYTDSLPVLSLIRGLRLPLLRGKMRRLSRLAEDLRLAEQGKHKLPKLIWIEPSYYWFEGSMADALFPEANDDHPPSDTLRGQLLLASLYRTLTAARRTWSRSAWLTTYDEHGGFYDHVTPPPIWPDEQVKTPDQFKQRGPRVPALLVSPFVGEASVHGNTARGEIYDHCSTLKFLGEWLKLPSLSPRISSKRIRSLRAMMNDSARTTTPPLPAGLWEELNARLSAQALSTKGSRNEDKAEDMVSLSRSLRTELESQHPDEFKAWRHG